MKNNKIHVLMHLFDSIQKIPSSTNHSQIVFSVKKTCTLSIKGNNLKGHNIPLIQIVLGRVEEIRTNIRTIKTCLSIFSRIEFLFHFTKYRLLGIEYICLL